MRITRKSITLLIILGIILVPSVYKSNSLDYSQNFTHTDNKISALNQTIGQVDDIKLSKGIYVVQTSSLSSLTDNVIRHDLLTIPYSIITVQKDKTVTIAKSKVVDITNAKMTLDEKISTTPNSQIQTNVYSDDINIQPVWDLGYNGTGVVIAVVDTGIDFNHQALQGKMLKEKSFQLPEYGYESDPGPIDTQGHGTQVASIAAGYDPSNSFKGSAFGAKIVNAKFGYDNTIGLSYGSVLAAADWAFSLPEVDIVTMSLSEPEEGISYDVFETLVNTAVHNGKIVTSSAGNLQYDYTIGSPGSAPEAITVGASETGLDQIASFESKGPTYGNEPKPDVVAPGRSIRMAARNTINLYGTNSGTSFSTPIAAGTCATLLSAARTIYPNLIISPGYIKSAVLSGARDIGIESRQQGQGVLDVDKALSIIQASQLQDDVIEAISPRKADFKENDVPINFNQNFVISLISTNINPWQISVYDPNNGQSDFTISSHVRYAGYTSIYELKVMANPGTPLGNQILRLSMSNYHSYLYNISINVIDEPSKKVLLDLSHTLYDGSYFGPDSSGYKNPLDRKEGYDLEDMYNLFKQAGIWVDEFYNGQFTNVLLSGYDAIWMPSAFTQFPYPYFDHPYDDSLLTQSDIYELYRFIHNGGSLIADLNGTSIWPPNLIYDEASTNSLKAITSILDNSFTVSQDLLSTSSSSTPATYSEFPQMLHIPRGLFEFQEGIPIIDGDVKYAGIADFIGTGKILLMNSRNWRDSTHISYSTNFVNSLATWLKGNSKITSIEHKNENGTNVLQIGLDENILKLNSSNLLLQINNQSVPFSVALDPVNKLQNIQFDAEAGALLKLQISSQILNLTYYDTLDTREFIPLRGKMKIGTNNIELLFDLNPDQEVSSNLSFGALSDGSLMSYVECTLNPKVYDFKPVQGGDILQIIIDSNDPVSTYQDILSGKISFYIISTHGIKSEFNFNEIDGKQTTTDTTSTPTNSNSLSNTDQKSPKKSSVIGFSIIIIAIIPAIVYKNLKSKHQKF